MITIDYCIDTLDDMSLALIWLNIWMSTCYFLFHVNILFGKLEFYFQLLGQGVPGLCFSNFMSQFKVEPTKMWPKLKFMSDDIYMRNNNLNMVKYFLW